LAEFEPPALLPLRQRSQAVDHAAARPGAFDRSTTVIFCGRNPRTYEPVSKRTEPID